MCLHLHTISGARGVTKRWGPLFRFEQRGRGNRGRRNSPTKFTGVEATTELGKGGVGSGGHRRALLYPYLVGRWPDGAVPFVSGGGVLRGSMDPVAPVSTRAEEGLGRVSGASRARWWLQVELGWAEASGRSWGRVAELFAGDEEGELPGLPWLFWWRLREGESDG
jgi:hypothetical protein